MSPVQIHLMLNHVPVLATVIAVAILSWGLLRKNEEVIRVSFYLLIGSALVALPVYFSGEGAEEAVEHLPAVLESLIETHENWAKVAVILGELLGVSALVGAVVAWRQQKTPLWIALPVLALGCLYSGIALQTAHLGGLIRHSEIRNGAAAVSGSAPTATGAPALGAESASTEQPVLEHHEHEASGSESDHDSD